METEGQASDIIVSNVEDLPLYIVTSSTPVNFRPAPEDEVCFDFIPPHGAFRPPIRSESPVDFFLMLPLTADEIERFLAKMKTWKSMVSL